MVTYFIFNCLMLLVALLLAKLIISNSQIGNFGERFKKFCQSDSLGEYFLLVFIIAGQIMMLLNLFSFVIYNLIIDSGLSPVVFILDNNTNVVVTGPNVPHPDRWFPSGNSRNASLIGMAIVVYRITPGSGRARAAAALGALSVAIPMNVLHLAVESPNGFNRLMYLWTTYNSTGQWPANVPDISTAPSNSNRRLPFLPIPEGFLSYISNFLTNGLIRLILNFFRPVAVEGHLDDLIGQQLFIFFLLIIIVIGLIILCTLYFFISLMLSHKDFILKRFNNKFIVFYIKYQVFLGKLSQFTLPILILLGLIQLFVGLHFLITHPIPIEQLPIDLHTYFKKR
uniref:Uncharacterized protein n=1 Tax=Coniophora olivacea TaxID=85977 RepID=A0A896Z2L7_9AGAM